MEEIIKHYPEALGYHQGGKIQIMPRRGLENERDLSLAYTPGVAIPVETIRKNPLAAFDYTSKGHLVAVISNGTACLGLGNVGALACKPVMEGKAVLFKKFANIDAFDIEINEKDPDKFVEVVKAIAPTFGGINLEDIASPACFHIEERLIKELDIPVMHDDQHGTAIISAAALINAAMLTHKEISNLRIVVIGAGAAAISCARIYKQLGAGEILMFDSRGLVNDTRTDLNDIKKEFISHEKFTTFKEALKGADVLLGLARANLIQPEDIAEMNKDPMVFAMSNPVPEIMPEVAKAARSDVLMATGRSDYPNQINNVLGFPYIFKGALRVRASCINEEMKLAAAHSLAELARFDVPHELSAMFGKDLHFGREYLIPSAFDPRLNEFVSGAIAKAAVESKVSRLEL